MDHTARKIAEISQRLYELEVSNSQLVSMVAELTYDIVVGDLVWIGEKYGEVIDVGLKICFVRLSGETNSIQVMYDEVRKSVVMSAANPGVPLKCKRTKKTK